MNDPLDTVASASTALAAIKRLCEAEPSSNFVKGVLWEIEKHAMRVKPKCICGTGTYHRCPIHGKLDPASIGEKP